MNETVNINTLEELFQEELIEILNKQDVETKKDCLSSLSEYLDIIEKHKNNSPAINHNIKPISGHKGLFRIVVMKSKKLNLRVIFTFSLDYSDIYLLTAFEEKDKKCYAPAIRKAKTRIKNYNI